LRLIETYFKTNIVDCLLSLAGDVLLTFKGAAADVDGLGFTLQNWTVRRAVTHVSYVYILITNLMH
jgi:hypothetical protein